MHSKAAGLQQSVTNVQTANNLLNVAESALNDVQLLLQRIRSLVVESNSDINSESDLANIQAEIDQLLLEINKISSEANFNGLTLFNGQFDDGTSVLTHGASVQPVTSPLLAPNGAPGVNQVSNSQITVNGDPTTPGVGPLVEPFHQFNTQSIPALLTFQVISFATNAVDPDSGIAVGPGDYVEFTAYSTDPAMGVAPLYQDISALPINAGPIINAQYDAPIAFGGGPTYVLFQFSVSNLTANDVGASASWQTILANASPNGHSLTVNDGGDEGRIVSITLPQINTQVLNVSGIDITAPNTVNFMNQSSGASSSNIIAASDAELKVDTAIEQLSSIRAQIGAQAVALQQDADNNDTAIVNYTATESNIRDVDVGQATTDFTKQQILVSVGTSVLSQINVSAQQLTALLLNSFSGLSGLPSGGGA